MVASNPPFVSAHLPLVRVLITRPAAQAEAWVVAFARAGAVPIRYPTIEVRPPPSWDELDAALSDLARYDWVLFTGAAAARHTLSRMADPRRLADGRRRVAVVGNETRRVLDSAHVPVCLVPPEQSGRGLAQALNQLPHGTRILFPQALGGRVELHDALLAQGCVVDVVPASQTVAIAPLPPVPDFDIATFASPSALRAYVAEHSAESLRQHAIVVIGPTTEATARALGLAPELAAEPSIDAVLEAVARAADAGLHPPKAG